MELYQVNRTGLRDKRTISEKLYVKYFTTEQECIEKAEKIAIDYKKQGGKVDITCFDGFDWKLYKVIERQKYIKI